MHKRGLTAVALLCTLGLPAGAKDDQAGDFDYYVMSLSWSPNWCALEGDARDDPQCDAGRGLTWVLHGLWPQFEEGWPSYCRTVQADPTRRETAAMADIMGGAGLAFYQWRKHGRCSGLSAQGYFDTARDAYGSIKLPEVFETIPHDVTLPASVVEDAFLEANPNLQHDAITITCKSGMIQEARICLTRNLKPRRCGNDVIRDCRLKDAGLAAVR